MTLPFDPTTAMIIAGDRAAALRRDWGPLHTSPAWRTGTLMPSELAHATPTDKPACPTTPTRASASGPAWATPPAPSAWRR
jgi:hypothetical protein